MCARVSGVCRSRIRVIPRRAVPAQSAPSPEAETPFAAAQPDSSRIRTLFPAASRSALGKLFVLVEV
jgi:hypothetical protein